MADNSKLFEKFVLNNKVEVPSRLVIPPLTLVSSNPDGSLSEGEKEYLKVRATGVGLYILGAEAVNQEGIAFSCQPRCYSEEHNNKCRKSKSNKRARSSSNKSNSSWRITS